MMKSCAILLGAMLALQAVDAAPAKFQATVLDTTFHTLIRGGDVRPKMKGTGNVTLGAMYDAKMRPVLDSDGKPRLSGNFDFTTYHNVPSGLVSIVQLEVGPASYFAMGLQQDKNGHLRVNTLQEIDLSKWEGSVRPCAGSLSPWNTHLGGEENYPDVRDFTKWLDSKDLNAVAGSDDVKNILNWHGYYLGGTDERKNAALKKAAADQGATYLEPSDKAGWFKLFETVYKPYMIGHIIEISPVTLEFAKHMALGRSSFEAALVMPDLRTVYLTDDSSGGGLMRFVAAKKKDLSKGTLYAAKFQQTNPDDSPAGKFTITWIKMADMVASVVDAAARKPLSEFNFNSIFLTAELAADGTCPAGFKRIDWEKTECLKLNTTTPNVEMLAAGLESRRFIPFVGGTSEFSKWEGITLHQPAKGQVKLFTAISYQRNKMTKELPAAPGQNDVRVKGNYCGCTYAMNVDKYYTAYNMYPEVCGVEMTVNGTNTCSKSYPANPDNADMMDGFPWLIISEDSDNRDQCFTMVHNVDTKQNIVVASAEGDSEVTSGWLTDLGSYSYITQNYQGFDRSPIGYLGPWKLNNLKSVTFKPHTPKGKAYVNPYAPFTP